MQGFPFHAVRKGVNRHPASQFDIFDPQQNWTITKSGWRRKGSWTSAFDMHEFTPLLHFLKKLLHFNLFRLHFSLRVELTFIWIWIYFEKVP